MIIYGIILILCFIGSIIFDAKNDAIITTTDKISHWTQTISIMFLFSASSILIYKIYNFNPDNIIISILYFIGSYILLRIGLFNLAYNHFRNLPNDYIGTTDEVFDKTLNNVVDFLQQMINLLPFVNDNNKFMSNVMEFSLPIIYIISIFGGIILGLNA